MSGYCFPALTVSVDGWAGITCHPAGGLRPHHRRRCRGGLLGAARRSGRRMEPTMPAPPRRMMAVEITAAGGPDVLRVTERPVPEPGIGEVLVRVEAAGVNRPDVMQRQGKYPPPPGASDIPGLEIAGTVKEIGAGVTGFQLGDRVCALVAGGGYAEYCAAPALQCLPAPRGLDLVATAAIPETF